MPFRDDREALRAQRDALQQERDQLERQLEAASSALARHESKDVTDEKELKKLRKDVNRLRGRLEPDLAAGRRRAVILMGVVGLLVTIGVVTGLVMMGGSEAPPVYVETQEVPAEPAAPPVPEPVPKPVPSPVDVALFGAVVLSAQGVDLAPGEGCVLAAAIEAGPELGAVHLRCRGLEYDPSMSGGTEMTAVESAVVERRVEADRHVYRVRHSDVGTRTGPRPQIVVDTARHELRLFRTQEASAPFDVQLYVESESLPRVGPALGTRGSALELIPGEPDAEREAALARASEGTACDLGGGWVGRLRTLDAEYDGLALRPTSTSMTITIGNGRTVQRERQDGPQSLTVPGHPADEATVALDCDEHIGVLATATGARYVGHLGPGNATFLGHNTDDPEWPMLFWLRRETDAETSIDVPGVQINIDQVSVENRRAIHEAIREAL